MFNPKVRQTVKFAPNSGSDCYIDNGSWCLKDTLKTRHKYRNIPSLFILRSDSEAIEINEEDWWLLAVYVKISKSFIFKYFSDRGEEIIFTSLDFLCLFSFYRILYSTVSSTQLNKAKFLYGAS